MTNDEGTETPPTPAERKYFTTEDGLTLSYLDYGGDGPVLLALHGHLNEGQFVDQGGVPADIGYRVIALDQRGHGRSEHASSYATERYVDDAVALLDHLGFDEVTLLGHSLGGAVAYLLAARVPARVAALVVVDIGAVIDGDLSFVPQWPRRADSRDGLIAAMGFMGVKQAYVIRHYDDGWGAPWDGRDMDVSQRELNGDHWTQWLASKMPVLLIHGATSTQLSAEQAEEMARRRPSTTVTHLQAGHAVYIDDPLGYADAVRTFLSAQRATMPSCGNSR